MKILQHRLSRDDGTAYPFRRSPNQSSGTIEPEYLVMHYTAGASAESSVDWLTNPDAKASAHLVISRAGDITQLVAFNRKAWHAGVSRWAGRDGVNSFSIGIELANSGILNRQGGGWRTEWGGEVDDADVIEAAHKNGGPVKGWQAYPTAQLETALEVATVLARRYGLKDVVGHDDIAPERKTDPGPAFPMSGFRAAVTGRSDDEPQVFVTTTALNIRSGPGTDNEKLPGSPMPQGTRLEVVAEQGVWREVDVLDALNGETHVRGWVHASFIAPA